MKRSVNRVLSLVLSLILSAAILVCTGAATAFACVCNRTKVGISWNNGTTASSATYMNAIRRAGGTVVMLPEVKTAAEAKKALDTVDALVMTGGADINPAMYGEERDPKLETVDDERDLSDSTLMREAIREDKPTLAICRSCQMLNVVQGGTLYQDLPSLLGTTVNHRDPVTKMVTYHTISVTPDNLLASAIGGPGTYRVNSAHHQGVKDLGKDLEVVARAEDGLPEGLVLKTCTFFLGTQFHPELMIAAGQSEYVKFFRDLMAAA